MKLIVLYSPFPTLKDAKNAARSLLRMKLIACANIVESSSVYQWKGKLVDEGEFILLAKTTDARRKKLEAAVRKLHPYELPAILFFSPSAANKDYSEWVFGCCKD